MQIDIKWLILLGIISIFYVIILNYKHDKELEKYKNTKMIPLDDFIDINNRYNKKIEIYDAFIRYLKNNNYINKK